MEIGTVSISGAIWWSWLARAVELVPVSSVGITAAMNVPSQISRTAVAGEDAATTRKPSASSARTISCCSLSISFTTRTPEDDIGDLTIEGRRELRRRAPGSLVATTVS